MESPIIGVVPAIAWLSRRLKATFLHGTQRTSHQVKAAAWKQQPYRMISRAH